MFRKVSLTLLAAVLVAGTVTAVPANAASKISNGVACSKAGARITSGGFKYQCAKNVFVKNSKLTWLSTDCIAATKQYSDALNAQKDFETAAPQIAKLNTDLAAAELAFANASKGLEDAKKSALDIQAQIKAAILAKTDVTVLTQKLNDINGYVLRLTKAKPKLASAVSDLKAQKILVDSTPDQLKSNISQSKSMGTLVCSKGL